MKTVMLFVEFASSDVNKTFQWERRGLHDDPGHPVRRRETLPAERLEGAKRNSGVFVRSTTAC